MISAAGFAALRVAATLGHTVPGLRVRLRDADRVRVVVTRPAADELSSELDERHPTANGVRRLSPCGFRRSVIESALLHQAGRSLALLDLASDPAIDIGVPADGRSWPGGIYRVPLEGRWLYAFATTLDAESCHAVGRPIVEAAGTVPQLDALGMRGDPDTGVTVLYAESSTTLTPVDELRVRALLEELLACFTAEELVRELHAGAFN